MRREYRKLYETYNRPCNPYFRDMLIKSYTYKGPVLEWCTRVKIRLEEVATRSSTASCRAKGPSWTSAADTDR